ncbi:putative general transcription factor 3C polypeptide 1-like, partial [Triplophysa rosa]
KFMLIQWIEDPPTWDVLPVDKIVNGHCEIGGPRSAMMKQLYCAERDSQARNIPQQDEVGRGQHKKYRRILSDSESSEEFHFVEKKASAKIHAIRARSFLEQYKADKSLPLCYLPQSLPLCYLPQSLALCYLPQSLALCYLPQSLALCYLPQSLPLCYLPQSLPMCYLPQSLPLCYLPQSLPLCYLPQSLPLCYLPQGPAHTLFM